MTVSLNVIPPSCAQSTDSVRQRRHGPSDAITPRPIDQRTAPSARRPTRPGCAMSSTSTSSSDISASGGAVAAPPFHNCKRSPSPTREAGCTPTAVELSAAVPDKLRSYQRPSRPVTPVGDERDWKLPLPLNGNSGDYMYSTARPKRSTDSRRSLTFTSADPARHRRSVARARARETGPIHLSRSEYARRRSRSLLSGSHLRLPAETDTRTCWNSVRAALSASGPSACSSSAALRLWCLCLPIMTYTLSRVSAGGLPSAMCDAGKKNRLYLVLPLASLARSRATTSPGRCPRI